GEAQYGYGHALDIAHAGFKLRVFCGITPAGGAGRRCLDGGTAAVFSFANSAETLCSDVGAGRGNGGVSGGGAYCAGTLWAVFVVKRFGAGDGGAGASP